MHLIQIDGAQKVSRMCMRIEFLIQVLKTKECACFLAVGMALPSEFLKRILWYLITGRPRGSRFFVPANFRQLFLQIF